MRILGALCDALFRPLKRQNSLQDRKLPWNCWVFALISQLTRWWLEKSLAGAYQTCSYKSLHRGNVQEKYKNSVSECSFSPLSASECHYCAMIVSLLRNDRGQNATGSFRARENHAKPFFLSLQFSLTIRSISSSTLCYEGVKIIRLLSFSN